MKAAPTPIAGEKKFENRASLLPISTSFLKNRESRSTIKAISTDREQGPPGSFS
jgi:hypothetical protein